MATLTDSQFDRRDLTGSCVRVSFDPILRFPWHEQPVARAQNLSGLWGTLRQLDVLPHFVHNGGPGPGGLGPLSLGIQTRDGLTQADVNGLQGLGTWPKTYCRTTVWISLSCAAMSCDSAPWPAVTGQPARAERETVLWAHQLRGV